MTVKAPADARQRIFTSAVRLFARKGFADVGIRDIAKEAKVNMAMISYYFGSKTGILRAILASYIEKYYDVLDQDVDKCGDDTPQYVHCLAGNLMRFYRDNIELAVVATDAGELDIPEIHDEAMRMNAPHRPMLSRFFTGLGLDTEDPASMALVRGFLTNMVLGHFKDRFVWEQIRAKHPELDKVAAETAYFPEPVFDDAFYEGYAHLLAHFYLGGVKAIAGRQVPAVDEGRGK